MIVYGILLREERKAAAKIAIRNIGMIISNEETICPPKAAYMMLLSIFKHITSYYRFPV